MTATEILKEEHRLIERVLDALERQVQVILGGGAFDPARSADTIRFIREFADRYHHAKEEDQLFPKMGKYGFGPEAGPVAVMLAEHVDGRSYVGAMAAETENPHEDAAGERYANAARNYVNLLREHIMKEDQVLYPMADSCLSEEDQAELLVRFRHVDTEVFSPNEVKGLRALAEQLCAS